jgi:tyrosyl-tRNA synthetase
MFMKLMEVKDTLMKTYFEVATIEPEAAITEYIEQLQSGIDPRIIKKILARSIVTFYH